MNHYQTLGVDPSSSQTDIKAAYRKLAMKHHPDRGGDVKAFQQIQEAYHVLGDEEKRKQYDNPQPQFNFGGFGQGHSVFEDFLNDQMFSELFRNHGVRFNQGARPQQRKNKNIKIPVQITLLEIITGKKIEGEIQLPSGNTKTINFTIPPGMGAGNTLQFKGLGDDSIADLPPGDLLAEIHEIRDPKFFREGTNLVTVLEVSVFDAIIGTTIPLETLTKETITIEIPPLTLEGYVVSVLEQGIPVRNTLTRGNLYVKIHLTMPKHQLSNEDRTVLQALKQRNV